MKKPEKLSFPKDELPHPAVIEWWYFNGNLYDKSGRPYAFMYCLFKADPRQVKLPFFKKIPIKDIFFSHYLLSDIQNKKMESAIDFFYEGMGKGETPQFLCFESGNNFSLKENPLFNYELKTNKLDLKFVFKKPRPLLVNQTGWVDLKTKNTYYYSLTDLEAGGSIVFGDKKIAARGKAWMDHQWADSVYSKEDKWVWFSIQLENKTEILCFEYGDKTKTRLATISYPDGHQDTAEAVFSPLGKKWKSAKTGADYQLNWQIKIPDKNIVLSVKPKSLEQEVIFDSINYWEGATIISGLAGNKKVRGDGFLELVGSPMGKSAAQVYLEDAKRLVSGYLESYLSRP